MNSQGTVYLSGKLRPRIADVERVPLTRQQRPLKFHLILQTRQCGYQNLGSLIPHKNRLCRINQNNDSKILLRNISDEHVFVSVQFFGMCMSSNTPEKQSRSQPPPRRTVPRRMKMVHRPSLAVLMKLHVQLCWMRVIGSKQGLTCRKRKMLLSFRLLCWCSAPRDMTTTQWQKWKQQSWVSLRIMLPVFCVAIPLLLWYWSP